MKCFQTLEVVKSPPDQVWRTVRDRLNELVPYLDDIRGITTERREELPDGTVHLVNIWRAEASIPAVLKTVIKPEYLAWTDRACWNPARHECTWQIELHFYRERTRCRGTTLFEPAMGGRGTRVTFSGEFALDTKGMAGVPAILESTVAGGVESFVTALIPRNFRKLIQAAGSLLSKSAHA